MPTVDPVALADQAQAIADEIRRLAGVLASLHDLAHDWESIGHGDPAGYFALELREIIGPDLNRTGN